MGASEASPFIRTLMHAGPATGVVLSKVVALGIGGLCVWANRIIKWITYWYGGLVVWNLMIMLHSRGALGR